MYSFCVGFRRCDRLCNLSAVQRPPGLVSAVNRIADLDGTTFQVAYRDRQFFPARTANTRRMKCQESFGTKFAIRKGDTTYGLRKSWQRGAIKMLMTIFVILMVMWLLGMVTSYTLYGFIHILLIIAVAMLLIRVIQGRRPL
jgi:hypothetical protein